MPSRLAWLDHTEKDRQRILDLVDLFREQDTRDELGIGAIRDGISDLLFPGTSTIQTRARYFLLIPWIYLGLERKRVPSATVAKAARKVETDLIEALKTGGESAGVIGIEAGKSLKRLPSSVYWSGLFSWGIRLYGGSQDQYHRSLDSSYRAADHVIRTDDDDIVVGKRRNWHPALPPAPAEFGETITFALTREEALFLQERILSRHQKTLLAHLVDHVVPWQSVPFPWEHPALERFPDRTRRTLRHGRSFSVVMHGAALLYNLLVAESAGMADLVEDYRREFTEWGQEVSTSDEGLQSWDRRDFWSLVDESGARVGSRTRRFVDEWIDFTLSGRSPTRLMEERNARVLVTERERQLKAGRARIDSSRARELWSGAAGTARLDYRWFRAQRILLDILDGLNKD